MVANLTSLLLERTNLTSSDYTDCIYPELLTTDTPFDIVLRNLTQSDSRMVRSLLAVWPYSQDFRNSDKGITQSKASYSLATDMHWPLNLKQ